MWNNHTTQPLPCIKHAQTAAKIIYKDKQTLINAQKLVEQVMSKITEVNVEQLQQVLNSEVCLVDVREPNEFSQSVIDGMVNMPRGLLEFQIASHPKLQDENTPIYLICRSGGRSALAAESLQRMGYQQVYSVAGGMLAWQNAQ